MQSLLPPLCRCITNTVLAATRRTSTAMLIKLRSPRKHFRSLVTVHLKLISLVPNSETKFDKWTLLAEGYVWSSYLGKAMPCASEPWRLRPQASRTLAFCRHYVRDAGHRYNGTHQSTFSEETSVHLSHNQLLLQMGKDGSSQEG